MTSKTKILAVDDERALCNILALNLEDAGYEVTKAHSGNEALRYLKESHYDVIISDIRMPDGDGIELLMRTKELDPSLPVMLFITAFADITVAEAYHLGAEAFFKKPVKYDQLITKVEECLKKKPGRWLGQCPKVNTDIPVSLTFDSLQSAAATHEFTIGRGGFFLKFDNPQLVPNKTIAFRIAFNDGQHSPLGGRGICRWRRSDDDTQRTKGVGIEFLEIDDVTLKNLISIIDEKKTVPYIPIE